ncbi:unnamed protein product [Caenorhabditis bovis]|uniref:Uncharacterized protein n=1 Tax=Caenorhabditis bovis TaxID=2654633 RepID=A0A8S1EQC7_9PELO|nr:unnamed protein product [Caenorhabditis bovis]
MQFFAVFTCVFIIFPMVKSQEEIILVADETMLKPVDTQDGSFSNHIVALRPDYTFWRMIDVLKTMFDSQTAEKRRLIRDADEIEERSQKLRSLRGRRPFLNFGRYRVQF